MPKRTRVIFDNGSDVTHWNDDESPAKTLTEAVRKAEQRQNGKKHSGAWLEFTRREEA